MRLLPDFVACAFYQSTFGVTSVRQFAPCFRGCFDPKSFLVFSDSIKRRFWSILEKRDFGGISGPHQTTSSQASLIADSSHMNSAESPLWESEWTVLMLLICWKVCVGRVAKLAFANRPEICLENEGRFF